MADEKDRPAPAPTSSAAEGAERIEGPTRQFSLKLSSWLADLGSDLDAPAPAAEEPLDELLSPPPAATADAAAAKVPAAPSVKKDGSG
jgi:hypothetical protein